MGLDNLDGSRRYWKRRIKYEAELDASFPDVIAALPGAENLHACIQCGTCTGSCPMSPYMDYTPRQIIAMTRAGFKQEVLGCFTIWLCSSCYACTVACPKTIRITDVMYALKRHAIRDGVYPKRFAIPMLAREFFRVVWRHGRSSEGRLLFWLFLRTDPLRLVRIGWLGMRLMLRGRLGFHTENVRNRDEVHKLMPPQFVRPSGKGAAA